ncbi:bifunctional 5,10-methylenetetrahydrofolate dehydrogenase/5,10-methenyltetrahydrofolate cyclohydrolase [Mariniplasma anaerobium]|uniref:Bifunctional protein FolD n=1 Tax=Mariniplasma anaerobium TaxID=2735436 RepID=A0A7U9THG9_9MOLU|nr:bifunctional 5,10-methylenetetrahydrofolate dehydrogenase/5,10-methenyltetrahydrofolate cyclohydrolase [Mariniplasma anaerobium]BCR35294.1 bifunctional protein FolD [Mariniplasma anaerobium]
MILLDGKALSIKRNLELKEKIERIVSNNYRSPKLAIILVGNNPASLSYVKGKKRACELVGIKHDMHHLDENISQKELEDLIINLNEDDLVDGILLQLPISKHLDDSLLIDMISKNKDADGFHVINQGYLYQKKKTIYPATPKGIMTMLKAYDINLLGMNAVVIGRSNIVGFPVARLLMDQGATITVCHSKTKDVSMYTKQADIIVVAAGRPHILTKDMVKKGAIVVDVGVNRVDGKLIGDADFSDLKEVCSYLTPVPGGVGPMTIHSLLENTFELYLEHIAK